MARIENPSPFRPFDVFASNGRIGVGCGCGQRFFRGSWMLTEARQAALHILEHFEIARAFCDAQGRFGALTLLHSMACGHGRCLRYFPIFDDELGWVEKLTPTDHSAVRFHALVNSPSFNPPE